MHIISKKEIETTRTPSEIYEWVFSILDKFDSKQDKAALRLKAHNEVKVFLEESYPLAIFCNRYFSADNSVSMTQIVGNQSYDVIVDGCADFNYIEITNAIDGHDDKPRNEEYKVLILRAVEKKAKIQYPKKTMLLVAFEDRLSFTSKTDIEEFQLFMTNELIPIVGQFSGLSLVGLSGNVFLSI